MTPDCSNIFVYTEDEVFSASVNVGPDRGAAFTLGQPKNSLVVSSQITAGAVSQETVVKARLESTSGIMQGLLTQTLALLDISLESGQADINGEGLLMLEFRYPDQNQDGVLDLTGVKESTLRAGYWSSEGAFEEIPTQLDEVRNTLSLTTSKLGKIIVLGDGDMGVGWQLH